MAAWGLSREVLRTVVGTVKRSAPYRRVRSQLASRCPTDVWVDGGTGFAHFEGRGEKDAALPAWFVFAVDLESEVLVAAKRLEPDESGENVGLVELALGERGA